MMTDDVAVMTDVVAVAVGQELWTVRIPAEKRTRLLRHTIPAALGESPAQCLAKALDDMLETRVPLHRALTPDDRIAIVVDEHLPHLGELLAATLDHLTRVPIPMDQVKLLVEPGGDQAWLDSLPDEFGEVQIEVHDAADSRRNAYLATTQQGRRIYLNRSLVDADAVIVLCGRRYVPIFGVGGAEISVYPAFSGHSPGTPQGPGLSHVEQHRESREVLDLLGSAFLIQIVEGPGDSIAAIRVGMAGSTDHGAELQDEYWKCDAGNPSDLVIAAISGDPARVAEEDFVQALVTARRMLAPNGRIAMLSDAAPELGESFARIRNCDDAHEAMEFLKKTDENLLPWRWVKAVSSAHVYLASGWSDEQTEELFATPLHDPAEVQRLIDAAERVLVIPDAHKCRVARKP